MSNNKIPKGIEFFIFIFFLCLYCLIIRGEYYTIDEMARYGLTKTIVIEHDMSITKPDGSEIYCPYPILQSVLAVPFYVIGEFFVGDGSAPAREEGGRFAVLFFCPIVTALSCVIFFRLCHGIGFKRRASLINTFVFGVLSIALVYSRMFLSEPLTGLLLLGAAALAISSKRKKPWGGVLAAFLLGLAATNNNVTLAVMGIFFLFFIFERDNLRDAFRLSTLKDMRLWALILFAAAAIAEGMWYNYVSSGDYFRPAHWGYDIAPNAVYPNGMTPFSYPILAGLYGFLLSPVRSIFLYSPPIIGALLFWPRFFKERRRFAALTLAIPLVFLLVYSKWFGWHGGYAWGPRYLVSVAAFLVIPFAYLIDDYPRLRKAGKIATVILCVFAFYVQFLATILHPALSYDRVIKDYGGMYNELMIMFLPQACSVTVQTRLLGTIKSLADTDLYFLKHLDSGKHILAASLLIAGMVVAGLFLAKGLKRETDQELGIGA